MNGGPEPFASRLFVDEARAMATVDYFIRELERAPSELWVPVSEATQP
jgi:hypothetical protein